MTKVERGSTVSFMDTTSTPLRCTVYGAPGTIISFLPCGSVAVRLDGETRVDYWHRSQVEVCS